VRGLVGRGVLNIIANVVFFYSLTNLTRLGLGYHAHNMPHVVGSCVLDVQQAVPATSCCSLNSNFTQTGGPLWLHYIIKIRIYVTKKHANI
jgi:hypothetical protein